MLVKLDLVAHLVPADQVEKLLQRDALCVQQQLPGGVENPQVAEHLALRSQERRVAALALGQPFDVVCHLALEE